MLRYANISTAQCGNDERRIVAKTEKADSHRSKESMGTFLRLPWLGKWIGTDSLLTVRESNSLMLEEAEEFSCSSDTKSTYSPWRIAVQVLPLTWAAISPVGGLGLFSNRWTSLGSPRLMLAAFAWEVGLELATSKPICSRQWQTRWR